MHSELFRSKVSKCLQVNFKYVENKNMCVCVCTYMFVSLCVCILIYVYIFIERGKQMWEMANGERYMVFIILFFQLFCSFEYSHNKKLSMCVGLGMGKGLYPSLFGQ